MKGIFGIWTPGLAVILMAATAVLAQDTRTVTEPVLPAACAKLVAEKTGDGEKLAEVFEKTQDTARIQKALNECKPGMAVELAAGEKTNAFVSGALEMVEGVTLLIDKGVTLYGSRDPKDYDTNPAGEGPLLCGTLSDVSTPYITAADAAKGGNAAQRPMIPPQIADIRECEECCDHGRWSD